MSISLRMYGYGLAKTEEERRSALTLAVNAHGSKTVFTRLNDIKVFQTKPNYIKAIVDDMYFVTPQPLCTKNTRKNKQAYQNITASNAKMANVEICDCIDDAMKMWFTVCQNASTKISYESFSLVYEQMRDIKKNM